MGFAQPDTEMDTFAGLYFQAAATGMAQEPCFSPEHSAAEGGIACLSAASPGRRIWSGEEDTVLMDSVSPYIVNI